MTIIKLIQVFSEKYKDDIVFENSIIDMAVLDLTKLKISTLTFCIFFENPGFAIYYDILQEFD